MCGDINMDKKGLKKLRKFIKNLPDEAFDWTVFGQSGDQLDSLGEVIEEKKSETYKHMCEIAEKGTPMCGTIGCVAGWASACHPKRFGWASDGILTYRSKNSGRLNHGYTEENAFAKAYDLTEQQAYAVVYGFSEYENSKDGALQCLDDLINGEGYFAELLEETD